MLLVRSNWRRICSLICSPSSVHHLPTLLCLHSPRKPCNRKERPMLSTDLEEIKAALWEQAYHDCTQVKWGEAQVMSVKKSRGQLLALLRGRPHWYPVPA